MWKLILLSLPFAAVISENTVTENVNEEDQSIVKVDVPLTVEPSQITAHFSIVNGSIGVETLSRMPKVKNLGITAEEINYIEDGALCSPPNVKELYLEHIDTVDENNHTIKNITFPALSGNILRNCNNLRSLVVNNIELEQSVFTNMPSLEELHIIGTKSFNLTTEFMRPLKDLKILKFSSGKIENADDGIFCLSPKMQSIEFWYNGILPPITRKLFSNCINVENIILDYGGTGHPKIEEGAFSHLPNLKSLYLSRVDLEHITMGFLDGSNLIEALVITDCNTKVINSDAFAGLANLKVLWLNDNEIHDLDPRLFENLSHLVELDLSSNKLKSLQNVKGLPELKMLKIARNEISEVDVKELTANLPKLQLLCVIDNPMSEAYSQALEDDLEKNGVVFHRSC